MKKNLEFINLGNNLLQGNLNDEMLGHIPVCKLTHEGGVSFLDLGDNELVTELPQCMFDQKSTLRDLTLGEDTVFLFSNGSCLHLSIVMLTVHFKYIDLMV